MYDFTFAHSEGGFDEHIKKSIRGYNDLLEDVVKLSKYFVEDNTNVYDLGCSTGNLMKFLISENKGYTDNTQFIGIELAESFFPTLENRRKEILKDNSWASVTFLKKDLREINYYNSSLITSIFTLQFIPKKDRYKVLKDIYSGLVSGGAFIFSEKIVCSNSYFQDMLTFNYYDFKRNHFTTEEILNKEKSLRHMLKPLTWEELLIALRSVGFSEVQQFWRNHMFIGAIAIK